MLSFSRTQRTVSCLVLVLLLAASLSWVWHIMGMQEDGAMTTQGCLLAGGRVMLCALNEAGQIGLWHAMYTMILPLAVILTMFVSALWGSRTSVTWHLQHIPSTISSWLLSQFRDWISFEPLRRAFSQGILHPKLYNFASS